MLAFGQLINGYTVRHIIGQERAGRPDGAVILAVRHHPELVVTGEPDYAWQFVIARIEQAQIDAPEPVATWGNGDYSRASDETLPAKSAQALADLLARASIDIQSLTSL